MPANEPQNGSRTTWVLLPVGPILAAAHHQLYLLLLYSTCVSSQSQLYNKCQSHNSDIIITTFKSIAKLFEPAYLPEIASFFIYWILNICKHFWSSKQTTKYEILRAFQQANIFAPLRNTIHHYQLFFFMKMNCFHSFSTEALLLCKSRKHWCTSGVSTSFELCSAEHQFKMRSQGPGM